MSTPLFLVVCDGAFGTPPMVLAAYIGEHAGELAQADARTITGASVLCLEARTTLRESARDDVEIEWDDLDTPTPVEEFEADTPPAMPSAVARIKAKAGRARVDRSRR